MSELVSVSVGAVGPGLTPYQWGALMVGVVLGLVNLCWTWWLSGRSRRHSIEDEFWFRKVVAPSVIDKSIEFSSKWAAALSTSREMTNAAAKKKLAECKAEGASIISGCLCLKLYGILPYTAASKLIDEMIDAVTDCYYVVTSAAASDVEKEQAVRVKRDEVQAASLKLLMAMKDLQRSF